MNFLYGLCDASIKYDAKEHSFEFVQKPNSNYPNLNKIYPLSGWIPRDQRQLERASECQIVATVSKKSSQQRLCTLSYFPSNCGYMILSAMNFKHLNEDEVFKIPFIVQIINLCDEGGYTGLLYTVTSDQQILKKELLENGFTECVDMEFVNRRTNNTIHTLQYII